MDTGNKRILVLGINSLPELTGIGKYTGEMLDWMVGQGNEITMVTAFPYYPDWKVQAPYSGNFYKKEVNFDGKQIIYRCPLYVPGRPSGLKRIIHEASFFLSAFFVVFALLFKKRADLVICVSPPFHLGFLALIYRFFKKSPVLYHIQDLQIDAAKKLKVLKYDWMFNLLFAMERFILNRVDKITTISDGMKKKVMEKTARPVTLFPNWVDTTNYFPIPNRDLLKEKWNFSPEDRVVLYSGSIGEKQGLDSLIRIAAQLKNNKTIKFVICGTGPFKDDLVKMAVDLDLKNVFFFPLQDNQVFNEFLNMADVHLVLQKGDASDLVMPSKLTTILSVGGLALVTARPLTTLNEVVSKYQMGVVIMPEDETLLREAIVRCCDHGFSEHRINARKYAENNLNKDAILTSLMAFATPPKTSGYHLSVSLI
ncbi:WcaI family glycosyltransferase [Pedobacter metabolipauper]|uniref:Colanic acid biosynthesis glycosyl transferase WcaI n=1 Tax=Pedobacter metabolipauper TaxID=425513 RepID=A0A4R6SVS9_9SPHI|nr:WcaI family glycosyltransferase [Pedobacter metabolipauper]TDQ09998.1 colanic acid biosynthesis glycosyl transferase WcaI [Pedobacter metabolipauper]